MTYLFTATALAALVLTTPALAKPDHAGKGKLAKVERGGGKAGKFDRSDGRAAEGKPVKLHKALKAQAKRLERADRAFVERRLARARDVQPLIDRDVRHDRDDRYERDVRYERDTRYDSDDWNDRDGRYDSDRRVRIADRDIRRYAPVQFVTGCPPRLAKKRNGCLPPGQAKKLYAANDRYARWFDRAPVRFRDGRDTRYYDGYLTRSDGRSITSYLPLLGSVLGVGRLFPAGYGQAVPDRYGSLTPRNDGTAYRYADNAVFAVDPTTRTIQSVVALVTGDRFVVGQPMPSGYDVYNVPGAYRDRYRDGPDANYRYADGQVYRINPTTRLIQAVASLLT